MLLCIHSRMDGFAGRNNSKDADVNHSFLNLHAIWPPTFHVQVDNIDASRLQLNVRAQKVKMAKGVEVIVKE